MTDDDELITLPDAATMLARLKEVSDINHLCEKFYPILLRDAGQQKYRSGIDLMVELALYDYLKDMPRHVVEPALRLKIIPSVKRVLGGGSR